MKKILSLFLAWTILTTTALAATTDTLFAALEKTSLDLTSADFLATIATKLNQPLEFLSQLPEDEYTDIDLRMLIENLADATAYIEGHFTSDLEKTRMDAAYTVSVDVPLTLSKDFSLSAWTKVYNWTQYNFTDANSPLFRTIVKNPLTKNYQVTELSNEPANLSEMFDISKQKQLQAETLHLMQSMAEVGYRNHLYTVHLTDSDFRSYIKQVLPLWKDYFYNSMISEHTLTDMYEKLELLLTEIPLLGSNGLTIQYRITPEGWITYGKTDLHLRINLHDILSILELNTNGLDYETAWIDLSVYAEETFTNHNKAMTVSFPEVNDENAIFLGDYDPYSYSVQELPIFTEDSVYYPIEKIVEHYGFSLVNHGDIVTITYPDGESSMSFSLNESNLQFNQELMPLEMLPAILNDGKLYCTEDVFSLLGISTSANAYGAGSDSFQIHSYYYNEDEEDYGAEEFPSDPDDIYQPRFLYYDLYYNRMPPIIDGQCYIPLYEFLLELTEGDFCYFDQSLTFTATVHNLYELVSVTATVGDRFLTWNNTELELTGAIVEQDGIMYIPASFPTPLGISIEPTIHFYPYGPEVRYHWSIDNPNYTDEFYSSYTPYYLNFYVSSDQTLFIKDENIYVPAYDLFESLADGSFSFEDETMHFTVTDEARNPLNIQSLSVSNGDAFVTVNGEQIALNAPVEEINQILRIPVSFVEHWGIDIESIYAYPNSSHFSLSIKNPDYQTDTDRLWYEF